MEVNYQYGPPPDVEIHVWVGLRSDTQAVRGGLLSFIVCFQGSFSAINSPVSSPVFTETSHCLVRACVGGCGLNLAGNGNAHLRVLVSTGGADSVRE